MSSSIFANVIQSITPQIVSAVSARLQEPEGAVEHGLTGAVAALLAGIANRGKDAGFWSQILELAGSPANSGGTSALSALALGTPNTGLMSLGSSLLALVFGSQKADVSVALAQHSGIGAGSANSILGLAAPLVLGWLNQQIRDHHMNASSLASFVGGEAAALEGSVPLGIRGILGNVAPVADAPFKGVLPLWPILGVALLAGLVWYFLHYSPKPAVMAMPTDVPKMMPANTAYPQLGAFFMRKLPSGLELNIPQLGIENKLVQFIEDESKAVDKTTWFDFDRLLFDTGKATLQPASQEQLQNIANILKAFPKVKLKIGGYTDNVGDKTFNMKLSSDRATNVMAELVGMGIDNGRLDAEGYGEEHPVGDNATEEGRAQNRRISLRVTAK